MRKLEGKGKVVSMSKDSKAGAVVQRFSEYMVENYKDRGRTHTNRIIATYNTRNWKRVSIWAVCLPVGVILGSVLDQLPGNAYVLGYVKVLTCAPLIVFGSGNLAYMFAYAVGEWLGSRESFDWVPLKERSWTGYTVRVWIVAVIATILVCRCIFFLKPGTPLLTGQLYISVGIILALLPFLHRTKDELDAAEFGIPDERTQILIDKKAEFKTAVQERKAQTRKKRAERSTKMRQRFLGGENTSTKK